MLPVAEIPTSPGVYQFLDGTGKTLYVGKAKSLKARLSQYFKSDTTTLHPRTQKMLETAESVAYTVVSSEAEALLMEASLVKSLQPAFNVKLREDHAYPGVVLSGHRVPRIYILHGPAPRGATRFGPYPTPAHAKQLLSAITLSSALRPCRDSVFEHHEKAKRACLLGEAGVCSAPCISPEGYEERVADARRVLEGETKAVSVSLHRRMESLAAERRYEAAAKARDALSALTELGESGVASRVSGNVAAVSCASDDIGSCVQILVVRDGTIVASPTVLLDNAMFSTGSIAHDVAVTAVLLSTFSKASPPPPMLLLETPLSVEVLESLSTLSHRKVRSKKPAKGPSRELLDLAQRNAAHALSRARTRRAQDADSRRNELVVLADVLGLSAPPLKIECVDISHIGGNDTTAAFAVLEDGLAHRPRHRSFNLDTGNDDPASIYQAVQKRIAAAVKQRELPAAARDKSLAYLPQLLVVDGGPTQLAAALRAIEESGETLAAVSLAKRLEEVFLPGSSLPMRLALDSPALYVLQRARDAAHDWSLRCSKRKRSKRTALTGLEGVPGLGPKRLARLLSSVSLSDLRGMTPEEMPEFLPISVREAIQQHLSSV